MVGMHTHKVVQYEFHDLQEYDPASTITSGFGVEGGIGCVMGTFNQKGLHKASAVTKNVKRDWCA